MFVSCDVCSYDSGDRPTGEELAEKVKADGGKMERVPPHGAWDITCPNGHNGDEIHLD